MVRIDRVVTRGGDGGTTSLGDGARRRKDDARIEAIGAVDEANAAIGWLRVAVEAGRMDRERADQGGAGGNRPTPPRLRTWAGARQCWRESRTTCSTWAPTCASPAKAATACA